MKDPKTISFSGKRLAEMKRNNEVAKDVLSELKSLAERVMSEPTLKVIDRKMRAISGNIHDYCSIGTYWWPNPDTPDGLPYVRNDGIVNPLANDPVSYENMANNVIYLALAAYYFDDENFAKASVKAIYDWFLNPETYMTPHGEYSQAIPGICNGRGIGIVDFRFCYQIFDAVAILESMDMIDKETVTVLKEWFSKFADWLLTSENGLQEDMELNNHGTRYDIQLLAIAAFTGRETLFKNVYSKCYQRRFKYQICQDGSQPLELARTMGMIYSLANIEALAIITNISVQAGYTELLNDDEYYGTNATKKAMDFIYPYAKNPETFPYQEINYHNVPEQMIKMLLYFNARYPNDGYAEKAEFFKKEPYIWLAMPRV